MHSHLTKLSKNDSQVIGYRCARPILRKVYQLCHILNHAKLFGVVDCDTLPAKPADCGSSHLVALPHQRAAPHRVRATAYVQQAEQMMQLLPGEVS